MRALQVVILPTLTYAYNNGVSRTPPLGTRNWSSGASDPEVEWDSIRERERLPQRDPSALPAHVSRAAVRWIPG